MRAIRWIVGGIPRLQLARFFPDAEFKRTFFYGYELAGVPKVGRTLHFTPMFQRNLIELDVFLQMKRGECADLAT